MAVFHVTAQDICQRRAWDCENLCCTIAVQCLCFHNTKKYEGEFDFLLWPLKMWPGLFHQVSLNCSHCLFPASFEVTVPKKHLLAIRGRPAVLGCEFTPDPDLSSLVVTWQRQEDARVVHSFYYQQDQLDRQSLKYHNRTSLYISELRKGNASLRISAVRPKDAGWYLCVVSNAKGTGRALMQVTYGGKREHQENVLCSVSTFQELPASFPVTEK